MRLFQTPCGLAATAMLFAMATAGVVSETETTSMDVSDRYIIALKSGVDAASHLDSVRALHEETLVSRADGQAFEGVTDEYNISDFQAYAGHFDERVIEKLRNHNDIETIEPDRVWTTAGVLTQEHATYGLALISSKNLQRPTSHVYEYDQTAGMGTYAYVLDSGINVKHVEFQGRATLGYNALTRQTTGFDDNYGHGSHIAGIIGSKTFGVAKKTNLIAVKVCERDQAKLSQVIAGLNWAVNDITSKKRADMSVINVSIYGEVSAAWSNAVDSSAAKGVSIVLVAGNENKDINKGKTTAHPKSAIIVSATDDKLQRAAFANWGSSVDIFAPGVKIMSTFSGDRDKTAFGSGTSQASAFVAGLTVYFKRLHAGALRDAKATKAFLLKQAHPNVVQCPSGPRYPFAYNREGKPGV